MKWTAVGGWGGEESLCISNMQHINVQGARRKGERELERERDIDRQ